MKVITSLLILTTINCCYAQDTIYWKSNYCLQWSDFKGVKDSNSVFNAKTVAVIKSKIQSVNDTLLVEIYTCFLRKESYTNTKNEALLLHERGHFDITEIFSRKLIKALSNIKYNSKTIKEDYDKVYSKVKAERELYITLYDKETNHSINKQKQEFWNNKISKELKLLEKFKIKKIKLCKTCFFEV